MAQLIDLTPTKTYATRENAIKAAQKRYGDDRYQDLTFFIATHTDGRFFPVFMGERAVRAGVHFHFNIVG